MEPVPEAETDGKAEDGDEEEEEEEEDEQEAEEPARASASSVPEAADDTDEAAAADNLWWISSGPEASSDVQRGVLLSVRVCTGWGRDARRVARMVRGECCSGRCPLSICFFSLLPRTPTLPTSPFAFPFERLFLSPLCFSSSLSSGPCTRMKEMSARNNW